MRVSTTRLLYLVLLGNWLGDGRSGVRVSPCNQSLQWVHSDIQWCLAMPSLGGLQSVFRLASWSVSWAETWNWRAWLAPCASPPTPPKTAYSGQNCAGENTGGGGNRNRSPRSSAARAPWLSWETGPARIRRSDARSPNGFLG